MNPGRIGESQGRILEHLKRRGPDTIPALALELDLSVETVRSHLKSLVAEGLVARVGRRRSGPGRPEIVYGLQQAAERLFPNREAELLQEFTTFLEGQGATDLIARFFEERVAGRRQGAVERVRGLEGEVRLAEVVRVLAEEGFMPEVDRDEEGRPLLRLTHCPLRGLVDVTRAPCRAELGFVRELLGTDLVRVSYIPDGDAACCYAVDEPRAAGRG